MSDEIIKTLISAGGTVLTWVLSISVVFLILKKPITSLLNRVMSAKLPWLELTATPSATQKISDRQAQSSFSLLEDIPALKLDNYGNLFWSAHDIMWTIIALANNSPRSSIIHGINQTLHHVRSLGFSNTPVEARLSKLRTDAEGSLERDWTIEKREEFTQELYSILHMIGKIAQNKQPGFSPNPKR